jgi:HEAT repeat protein
MRATPSLLIALKSQELLAAWRENWDKLGPFAEKCFLWQYLTAEISDIRCYSAISLGQLGDPAAVNDLIEAMNDKDDPNVRKAAAQALRLIGTPEALAAAAGKANE